MDPVLEQVGPRIRAARLKRGLTLAELAARTQMSASTLSRLESGKRQAHLELLVPLVRELRITLDDLVPRTIADPRVRQHPRISGGVQITALSPSSSPVRTYKIVYPHREDPPALRVHDGYEWLYVMAGRLRLRLADQNTVLEAGEAAEFDTRVPHSMNSAGPGSAEILSIFNENGARMHTRAHDGEHSSPGHPVA